MSKGIGKLQRAIMDVLERKGPMVPRRIWAEVDLEWGCDASFSNLCRSLRSLWRRGLLRRLGVHYRNPGGHGVRYYTPAQYRERHRALEEKYGPL